MLQELQQPIHRVQQTSLLAFDEVQKTLTNRQAAVFRVIQHSPSICNQEVAEFLGLPINSVTPRVLELRQQGVIWHAGFKNYRNRKVMVWRAA